jgi:hypothetical protein
MASHGKYNSAGFNRLSDRDMLFDLLATEKQMSHLYDHAVMEATSGRVRETFIALQQDEQQAARMLFEFLQQKGWYTPGAGRQASGRRLQSGKRLSGGAQPRTDSRYAVTSGARNFGSNLEQSRRQGHPQYSRAGQGRQEQFSRQEWNF